MVLEAQRVRDLKTYVFTKFKGASDGAVEKARLKPVDLSIGDPDEGARASFLKEAFNAAIREPRYSRYPSGRGLPELRRAIAAWMKHRFGVKLDPETEIVVLSGSKEGIAHLAMALLNPGERSLMGSCAYPVYERASGLAGAKPVSLPMNKENAFLADFSGAPEAKMIFINYPNNPTGVEAPWEYLRELAAWAKKRGVFVASDAAYAETYFNEKKPSRSFLEIPGAKDYAVEFHSFSKSFGLPGLRLGWVCGSASALAALLRLKDTYDSGVSNYIQAAGLGLLSHPSRDKELARLRALYGERRRFFEAGLSGLGIAHIQSGSTFYVWAPKGAWAEKLERLQVKTVDGAGFGPGGAGYLRFALCAPKADLGEALRRLKS